MAVTLFSSACVEPNFREKTKKTEPRLFHIIAPVLDIVIGIAILTIGILGMKGTIPMSTPAAYGLIGMGATYGWFPLAFFLTSIVKQCCAKDVYLFKGQRLKDQTE